MTLDVHLANGENKLAETLRNSRALFGNGRPVGSLIRLIQRQLIFVIHLKGATDPEDIELLRWTEDWRAEVMPRHSLEDYRL